jgi:hypothetical protein
LEKKWLKHIREWTSISCLGIKQFWKFMKCLNAKPFLHQYSSTRIVDVMLDDFIWKMFHLATMSSDWSSYFIQALILIYHNVSSSHISSYCRTSSNFNFNLIQSNHFIQFSISSINTNSFKNLNKYFWWISSNIWIHLAKKIQPIRIWFHPITLFHPIHEFTYPLVRLH